MNKNLLGSSLLCLCFYSSGSCFAAAFERSGQTIQPFFEHGNYAEISLAYIDPDVSGQVQQVETLQQFGITDFSTGNLSNEQVMLGAALKLQLNPQFKFAVIYDQPFAVDIIAIAQRFTVKVMRLNLPISTLKVIISARF